MSNGFVAPGMQICGVHKTSVLTATKTLAELLAAATPTATLDIGLVYVVLEAVTGDVYYDLGTAAIVATSAKISQGTSVSFPATKEIAETLQFIASSTAKTMHVTQIKAN